ncbi:hypothetical protein F4775DRAFT_228288 [Biscogniauxia sp. FL1348]|nr:hypothetical protein F4775DRAFT_228288 [Biscogniauxia sp. FL1348]
MSRTHPNWRGTGYTDERRRDSYQDTWRAVDDRARGRDYNRDVDKDRDRPSIRRDSRDGRDARDAKDMRDHKDFREPRGIPDSRSPRDLRAPRLDTAIPSGPRNSSAVNSPASSRGGKQSARPTPTELFPDKTLPCLAAATPATPFTPKAKDPKLQGLVESTHRWGKTWQELQLLQQRRDQLRREAPRRQQQAAMLGSGSADFPPYLEFEARFKKRDWAECAELDKQIKSVEQRYCQELEEAVSAFPTAHTPKAPESVAAKDPSVSALEARFDEFATRAEEQQKQLTEATNEIRSLLATNKKSNQDFATLRADFTALKSDYDKLEDENSRLRDRIIRLSADVDGKITAIESRINKPIQNVVPVEEFDQAKSSLKSLANKINEQSESSKEFKEKFEASERAQQAIDSKVEKLENQMESLDFGRMDEIIGFWLNHDLGRKVLAMEEYVNSIRNGSKSVDASIQGVQREMQSLKSQLTNHRSVPSEPSPAALPSQRAFDSLLREKLGAVEQSLKLMVKKHAEAQDDLIGGLIDEKDHRIESLEKTLDFMARQKEGTEARANSLYDRVQSVTDNLNARLSEFGEKRLGHRVDRVDLELSNVKKAVSEVRREVSELSNNIGQLENHYQELSGIGSPTAAYDAFVKSEVKGELEDTKKRLEALGLSVRSLDSQWSNVSSKQMAERIIQQLNPSAQSIEARVTKTEDATLRLRQDVTALVKSYSDFHEKLAMATTGEKRRASSQSPRLDGKKRKLEANGHNPVPPQRNGSVGREIQRSAS